MRHALAVAAYGFASSLAEAVTFYDTRFRIGLTQQEQDDLVAFLKSL